MPAVTGSASQTPHHQWGIAEQAWLAGISQPSVAFSAGTMGTRASHSLQTPTLLQPGGSATHQRGTRHEQQRHAWITPPSYVSTAHSELEQFAEFLDGCASHAEACKEEHADLHLGCGKINQHGMHWRQQACNGVGMTACAFSRWAALICMYATHCKLH